MSNEKKQHCNSKKGIITFWSLVLIVVLFFFFKNSGILTSVYLSAFLTWPLILFIISIICLIHREWVMGVVLFVTAHFFWLPKLAIVEPELCPCITAEGFVARYWYLLVAFIAVVLIIQAIFGKEKPWKRHHKRFGSNFQESKEGYIKSNVVFSSNEKIYLNENFRGGRFETVFGSQEVDLRKCIIPKGERAYIDLSVVFGNCEIWVPAEWTVQINTKSVFSNIEEKRIMAPPTGEDMLVINGEAVFSSVEIRS